MRRSLAALLILAATFTGCGRADERIVLAAGTTLVDSRLIERVIATYPEDVRVSVVGVSSREALALGDAGSADVLITHLPEAEAEFVAAHPGALQETVFTSRFVLAGPSRTPTSIVDAFRHIARTGLPFVSRGDGSGTAAKEEEIWALAGIDPSGAPWHSDPAWRESRA